MSRNYYELKTSYRYEELGEAAKENVKQWLNSEGYNWGGEALQTLQALAQHFGGRLSDWSIDWGNPSSSSVEFSMPVLSYGEFSSLLSELGAVSAETGKGVGDCKLTGVCFDEDAIDGLRAAFASLPVPDEGGRYDEDGDEIDGWDELADEDVRELFQAAWWSLALACRDDYESQFDDENIRDTCGANGYEFDKFGNFVL